MSDPNGYPTVHRWMAPRVRGWWARLSTTSARLVPCSTESTRVLVSDPGPLRCWPDEPPRIAERHRCRADRGRQPPTAGRERGVDRSASLAAGPDVAPVATRSGTSGDVTADAGSTAPTIYAFIPEDADRRVHLLVPATSKPRNVSWVTVRRTRLMDERVIQRGPLRLSCRPRAVIDAAAVLPESRARTLIIDVVRRRLVRLDDLAHWVEVRQTYGRVRLRRALQEAAAGAWSVPEADLAALVHTSRVLPTVWLNPGLTDENGTRLTTPDVWLDDVGMAVMIHS